MAHDAEEFLAYLTHLRGEHRELDQRVCRIERAWTGISSKSLPGVIHDLQILRGDLARHFEEEETGGCLDEAVSRQPNLGRDADHLASEHPELLAQLDRLIDTLKQLQQTPVQAQADFRRFSERLRAHEAAENRILDQSFGIDLE